MGLPREFSSRLDAMLRSTVPVSIGLDIDGTSAATYHAIADEYNRRNGLSGSGAFTSADVSYHPRWHDGRWAKVIGPIYDYVWLQKSDSILFLADVRKLARLASLYVVEYLSARDDNTRPSLLAYLRRRGAPDLQVPPISVKDDKARRTTRYMWTMPLISPIASRAIQRSCSS